MPRKTHAEKEHSKTHLLCAYLSQTQDALGFRPPFHGLLNSLMACLYVIHIYWFALILKVAYDKLATGRLKDVREEEEGNSNQSGKLAAGHVD